MQVAGRTQLQGDAAIPEPGEQFRVLHGADAMADAPGTQVRHRRPDTGRTGELAGVYRDSEPRIAGQTKRPGKERRRVVLFVARQVHAHHTSTAAGNRLADALLSFLPAPLPDDRHNEPAVPPQTP